MHNDLVWLIVVYKVVLSFRMVPPNRDVFLQRL